MTTLKEQAVQILNDVPDDKMIYLMNILRGLVSHAQNKKDENADGESKLLSERLEAYEGLKKYKRSVDRDIDAKEEMLKYRDERYANSI